MKITPELKNELKRIMWDYSVDENTLWAIWKGESATFSLNKNKLYARLLLSTPWYRLLDCLGLNGLKEILTDEVINSIWIKDIREKFKSIPIIIVSYKRRKMSENILRQYNVSEFLEKPKLASEIAEVINRILNKSTLR